MQVPPRSFVRKADGVTPYSKRYKDPRPRKQSRQERTTPLPGFRKPQSGKSEQVDGTPELEQDVVEKGSEVGSEELRKETSLAPELGSRVKWTTLLPPT